LTKNEDWQAFKLAKRVAVTWNMESYESEQVVHGGHVYKSAWTLFIGEEFPWVQVAPVAFCILVLVHPPEILV